MADSVPLWVCLSKCAFTALRVFLDHYCEPKTSKFGFIFSITFDGFLTATLRP